MMSWDPRVRYDDTRLAHQIHCDQCRQGVPCFTYARTFGLTGMDPGDPIVYVANGEVQRTYVVAFGNHGLLVQRSVHDSSRLMFQLRDEGVTWMRCSEDYYVPEQTLLALIAAHMLAP